ncbi:MAG: hypothetical protein WA323_14020, partial [Candidatus Nitrosopolaris sp.]
MITVDDLLKNFPFPTVRDSQTSALKEIDAALASGYRYIILEAPTGFGKSPVAIAVALTLGTSYICTSTKDLQTQYARDFPFLKVAKGKNNFPCLVKHDFIRNGTFKCGLDSNSAKCRHTTADYGPCMSNENFRKRNCKYRTFPEHYKVNNKGTREEEVFIDPDAKNSYQKEYSQWSYLEDLKEKRLWEPCEYFDQLNIALTSRHSIFNYSMLLSLLRTKKFPSRELLILDEAHLLETEIVRFREISISKKRWKRYIPNLKMDEYGYDVEKWIEFLIDLKTRMPDFTGNGFNLEMLSDCQRDQRDKKTCVDEKKVVRASDLFKSDKEIAENYFSGRGSFSFRKEPGRELGEELAVEVIRDRERLTRAINNVVSNPKNWIVSEIKKEGYEVTGVELKPLDTSGYCKNVFERCNRTLMMSATILDSKAYCRSLGLTHDEVKFIRVESDFPLQNRP